MRNNPLRMPHSSHFENSFMAISDSKQSEAVVSQQLGERRGAGMRMLPLVFGSRVTVPGVAEGCIQCSMTRLLSV